MDDWEPAEFEWERDKIRERRSGCFARRRQERADAREEAAIGCGAAPLAVHSPPLTAATAAALNACQSGVLFDRVLLQPLPLLLCVVERPN